MNATEWMGAIALAGSFVAWMTATFWKLGAIAQNTKHLSAKTTSIESKLDAHSEKFDEHANHITGLRMDVLRLESSIRNSPHHPLPG